MSTYQINLEGDVLKVKFGTPANGDQIVRDAAARLDELTAISSKTESGFKPSGNGVFYTLIDRFCAERYNHPFDPLS